VVEPVDQVVGGLLGIDGAEVAALPPACRGVVGDEIRFSRSDAIDAATQLSLGWIA